MFRRSFTLLELMIVVAIVGIIAAIAIPNLIESRKSANEVSAVKLLREVSIAQALFRERDGDGDGDFDFGNMSQLVTKGLLILGTTGPQFKSQGYLIDTEPSSDAAKSLYLWFGTAEPLVAGSTGDRYFCINHSGAIFYRTSTPFTFAEVQPDCLPPPDAIPSPNN